MSPQPRAGAGEVAGRGLTTGTRTNVPAALLLGLLTIIWAWWAWKEGAYFGVVLYPGAIALFVLLVLLVWTAPSSVRLSNGAAVAVIGTLALAAWTLLSMLWSPAPDEALSDGTRVLVYALCFVLGIWLSHLLGGRAHLALVPLAAAGGVVGVATALELLSGGDVERFIESGGSFQFPLGYRNANAAFFLIALWPALALTASPKSHWLLRGAMLGCGAVCVEFAALSQSRGSVVGVAAAVFVFLLTYPWRLRALAWLVLAVVPAAITLPWMLEPYQAFQAGEPVLPELQDAATAILITAALAVPLGALVARLEPAPRRQASISAPLLRPLAIGLAAVAACGIGGLVVAGEDPVDFVDRRVAEIGSAENPDLTEAESRFTVNVQSVRSDLWRVAWNEAKEKPFVGDGAGAFEYTYLRERDVPQIARDAHSVEMELLSEMGFPALVMFGAIVVGAAMAALRSRRRGALPAVLASGALACGAYWLAHASIDWFWTYPGLTAPVFALLGSAAAPALLRSRHRPSTRAVLGYAVALLAAVIVFVPLYLSERYTDDAYSHWTSDLDRAYADLDRAETLNPFADRPLLAEGAIAQKAGDRARAIEAYRSATELKPEEWVGYYLLARLLAKDDVPAAREAMARAAELNPRSRKVQRALEDLRAGSQEQPDPDSGG
jgi:O-Antigen ligase